MVSLQVESSSEELLSAQSHLWNHTFSFINSMSLKCAIELGIPDVIHKHGSPITLSDLSAALSVPTSKTPGLRRLMSLLVHSKFFSEKRIGNDDEEPAYSLTIFSKVLVTDTKTCISPLLLSMLDQTFLRPWDCLSNWFKREEPPTAFEIAHGMPIWEATANMPDFNKSFNEAMSCDASFTTEVIMRECSHVFRGLTSLVDVGGGIGTLAGAVAEAFPMIKCAVLELPQVIEGLQGSKNVQFVRGDMFDYVPPADATLLKWVLHDWSDQECVKILKRCKDAIPSKEEGGKAIIIEMVMNTDKVAYDSIQTQLLLDVHMMAHTTGKQRSEVEWKKIFMDAGFRGYKTLPILGLRSVIEVYH